MISTPEPSTTPPHPFAKELELIEEICGKLGEIHTGFVELKKLAEQPDSQLAPLLLQCGNIITQFIVVSGHVLEAFGREAGLYDDDDEDH